MDLVVVFFAVLYSMSMVLLLLYSLSQLDLTLIFLRRSFRKESERKELPTPPRVTIQIPVYNERFVVTRILDAVLNIRYPQELLDIQILDDSTDETTALIEAWVAAHKGCGVPIRTVRRSHREGFKAGALAEGLRFSNGVLVAVFDADFIPPQDFLERTVHYFSNHQVGVVQTKWGHINEQENLLTRLQAFGLDAHFTIEQTARMQVGSFMNFNGTAGIWRRSCIDDAGGWSADTLTEDLDLSYRAQLKGWRIVYEGSVLCPAELPSTIRSVVAQQGRWNKGGAETALKLLGIVLRAPLTIRQKIHAFFHLGASSVFLVLLVGAVSSIFLFQLAGAEQQVVRVLDLGMFSFAGFLAIFFFYFVSGKKNNQPVSVLFPAFLLLNMGLSLKHSKAVLSGWFGRKSEFVRTPKLAGQAVTSSPYLRKGNRLSAIPELLCGLLFLWMAFESLQSGFLLFTALHVLLGIGLCWVGLLIVKD